MHHMFYAFRAVSVNGEEWAHLKGQPDKSYDDRERTYFEDQGFELGIGRSWHLVEVLDFVGLRFEPELRYFWTAQDRNNQLGLSLPLRLQFGAMSASRNYTAWGVGFIVDAGPNMGAQYPSRTVFVDSYAWNYKINVSGIAVGEYVFSLEAGYKSYIRTKTTGYSLEYSQEYTIVTVGFNVRRFDL